MEVKGLVVFETRIIFFVSKSDVLNKQMSYTLSSATKNYTILVGT